MSLTHVSVSEARALQLQGHVYVDVRSTQEYGAGHPAGAVNVPLIEPDPDTGQPVPNPDFLRVMQAHFTPASCLLIGCQVGGRSMRAAQMLTAFGFEHVANVRGGFQGTRDRGTGQVVDPGWTDSGLPVETDSPAGGSYRDLLARADAGT
jgi:rhodanese-related sulfurtransferase